jgi:hypothetical protein
MKFLRILVIVVCVQCKSAGLYAQVQSDVVDSDDQENDTLLESSNERNYWLPALNIAIVNTYFWSFARYVLQAEYAYISPKTMYTNLKHGFV